jgi:UDP-GlcNAc:undecaprenyl-phosphate GlcNAc-1-phosphate transferase
MLDNMDAITASVSKGIMICVIGFLVLDGDFKNEYFIILIGMLGSLVGFMYFNWNPSKMYMGDTGSQFLGVFLAAIGIQYFWNAPDNTLLGTPESVMFIKRLLIPLTAFITITVVINRLMKKQSPFIGGKDHTTHALARLGLNDRQVALVFITLSITSSAMALLIYSIENWKPFYTIVFTAYILIVFFALNYPTNRKIKTA